MEARVLLKQILEFQNSKTFPHNLVITSFVTLSLSSMVSSEPQHSSMVSIGSDPDGNEVRYDEDEQSLNDTDNDHSSEPGEPNEMDGEFQGIEQIFGNFQEKFEACLQASFQNFAEMTTKFQEIDRDLANLASDVTAEQHSLHTKKRGALNFVSSFK